MNQSGTISIEDAKQQFVKLMQCLSKSDQKRFFSFILSECKPAEISDHTKLENGIEWHSSTKIMEDPTFILNSIADDLKEKLPLDCTLPSEEIVTPKIGENSDCNPSITLHLDEFIYDDSDVVDLVEAGRISRHYCNSCGSRNINPLIFISHSMARDELYFIFNTLLPTLNGKTILDIGSRLGAVLYGAYVYTDARRIIGVEMNKEFCQLQQDIVNKYKMQDRIEIIHKKIEDDAELIRTSDVIVINNPFEFYMSQQDQANIWNILRANTQQGTIIVMRPCIKDAISHLKTDIVIDQWLEPLPLSEPTQDDFPILNSGINSNDDKYSAIECYTVL